MQPGGGYAPRPSTAPSGAYYVHGGACFRDGSNMAYRQPPPQQQEQMTPQRREAVLMEAGRLAAEYLVAIGDLPPHALQHHQHRPPPAPLTFQQGPLALPRPRPFQERPLARQRFGFLPPASRDLGRPFAPRPFQGRAIAKRPRPFLGRPPPLHPARFPTQAALNDAPAGGGNGSTSQPVSQSGDTDQSSEMNQR
ncbi:hypothetical protein VPH35_105206 [Triticum aestivum]